MAYFMLDLLFLMGDPRSSTTLIDNYNVSGDFRVGETIKVPETLKRKN